MTIDRIGGSIGASSVDFSTALGLANAADLGGALPAGTLAFADGQTSRTVTIEIARDTAVEADKTIMLTLANPTGGAAIGDGTATGRDQPDLMTHRPRLACPLMRTAAHLQRN